MSVEFVGFPKLARLRRSIIVTEKLDGTNAAVQVIPYDEVRVEGDHPAMMVGKGADGRLMGLFAQSRKRLISPADDNYGFASWVLRNADDLANLGPGVHFGEWWGEGIQRRYGIAGRRFSLFNVSRWSGERPACCHVVPTLYSGPFSEEAINGCLAHLDLHGSYASPGFLRPEGVVVFHTARGDSFKITYEHDETGKEAA